MRWPPAIAAAGLPQPLFRKWRFAIGKPAVSLGVTRAPSTERSIMTVPAPLSYTHRFAPGANPARPPVLLLHGTGGNEDDLLPLGQAVAPGASLLSPRGKVLEGGMPRFFRRFAEGALDEEDVRRRAAELAAFIAEARDAYSLAAPIALGFSNGANIAAALLLLHPAALAGAALLRAMTPLAAPPAADLAGKPVLILSGAADPIIPAANAARLAATLEAAGASVQHETVPAGHGLSQADVTLTKAWFDAR
jgi:phospholipase/carboxylesterase